MGRIKKRENYNYLIVFNESYCYISDSRNAKVHLLANNEKCCRVYDKKGVCLSECKRDNGIVKTLMPDYVPQNKMYGELIVELNNRKYYTFYHFRDKIS